MSVQQPPTRDVLMHSHAIAQYLSFLENGQNGLGGPVNGCLKQSGVDVTGYFADSAPRPANPVAYDKDLARLWWEKSAQLVGIDP